MPRLGRVEFHCSYVVDLDDPDMVDGAREAVCEDVYNAVRFDEVEQWVDVFEDNDADPADIPEFLLPITVAYIDEPPAENDHA